MAKRFTLKFDILSFMEQKEIIGVIDLVDRFPMSEDTARVRLKRLKRAGLIEPLGIERGKWVLSVKGYEKLGYLRRQRTTTRPS